MLKVYEAIKDMNPASDLKPEAFKQPVGETRELAAASPKKQTTGKNVSSKQQKKRFVGVRQRPSGRWVAEIKDSTQKLRLWLGTFDNAEDAARAYDDAARALRGANTRTNFKAPPNGSARLSRATRLLLQRVAMRSQDSGLGGSGNKINDKPTKFNQQPYQSLHQGVGSADPCKSSYSASASASASATSLGFQQQPTSRTKKVVYSTIQRHQDHEFGFQSLQQQQALPQLADPSSCAAFDEQQTMLVDPPGTSTAHAQLPEDSDPPSPDYVFKSYAVWSVSQSPIYKVSSSVHDHQASAAAAAAAAYSIDSCDCEPLISGPSICGSESPIILSSNDGGGTSNAVSPKPSSSAPPTDTTTTTTTTTSNSTESFWSYFDQALCAVS